MSTVKSNADHLTLNADGASKDIKFQANGVEKASISSTGAFTSTSIDATKLTGNLPAISGAALTNLPGGGKVLQVLQSVVTSVASVSPGSAWTDWTGLSVTITPTSSTSKILITASVNHSGSGNHDSAQRLVRGATAICIGDANGSWLRATTGGNVLRQAHEMANYSINYLDSPSTTSATTYKLQCWDNATMWLNRETNATFYAGNAIGASTITVMEIGA